MNIFFRISSYCSLYNPVYHYRSENKFYYCIYIGKIRMAVSYYRRKSILIILVCLKKKERIFWTCAEAFSTPPKCRKLNI